MEQIVTDLLLAEPVWPRVEVVGQLPDGAEVSLLSALAEPGELKILMHPLAKCRGHVMFLSQREMKEPLRGTFRQDPACCQGGENQREFR